MKPGGNVAFFPGASTHLTVMQLYRPDPVGAVGVQLYRPDPVGVTPSADLAS